MKKRDVLSRLSSRFGLGFGDIHVVAKYFNFLSLSFYVIRYLNLK